MSQAVPSPTLDSDLPATPPTDADMDAMWLTQREADILDADVRAFERRRAAFAKFVHGEAA